MYAVPPGKLTLIRQCLKSLHGLVRHLVRLDTFCAIIAIEKVCNLGRVNLVALVLGAHGMMLYHMSGEHAELKLPGIKKLLQFHGVAAGELHSKETVRGEPHDSS